MNSIFCQKIIFIHLLAFLKYNDINNYNNAFSLHFGIAYCNEKGTLKTICPLITGDALLYSMFRETGNPMPCPFKPPYTFTYNRGHGECKNPVSTVEACTQDSRLLIRYQACPDVEGSESARKYMLLIYNPFAPLQYYSLSFIRENLYITRTCDLFANFDNKKKIK